VQDILTTLPSNKQAVSVTVSEDGRGLFGVKCLEAELIQV